jgi:hypothetical protein
MNIGDKHNNLTIIDKFSAKGKENRKGRNTPRIVHYYKVQCDCGTTFEVRSDRLKSKIGCKSCNITHNSNERKGGKYLEIENYSSKRRLYLQYKKSANLRGIDFNLSEDEFLSFISQNCFYCGAEPKESKNKDLGNTLHGPLLWNGIDRVDSNKGYEVPNCRPCCNICNNAKTNLNYEDFMIWLGSICGNR